MLRVKRKIEIDDSSVKESVQLAEKIKGLKELTDEGREKVLDLDKKILEAHKVLNEARQLGKTHLAAELIVQLDNLNGAKYQISQSKHREIESLELRLNELILPA